jgi:hypothetical protein
MADQARDLVDRMVEQDSEPDPRLLRRIYRLGGAAIEPLREVVRGDYGLHPGGEPAWFAFRLLCSLRATETIPDLIALFRRTDPEDCEFEVSRLALLGPGILPPLLEMMEDDSLDEYTRSLASSAAIDAAVGKPDWSSRVADRVRPRLEALVARAELAAGLNSLGEDDLDLAESLIWDLADLGDVTAAPLVDRAVAAGLIERRRVEATGRLARAGVGDARECNPIGWIADYERGLRTMAAEARRSQEILIEEIRGIKRIIALEKVGESADLADSAPA